ncbi:MAG: response regulator [Gammaproteobacteria bacterium]|nr:response regulator [Gammaproteobacteria bacterium]
MEFDLALDVEKKEILVVDDDPYLRELMAITLEDQDFDVFLAEHGMNAQEVLSRRKPHLIILDMMMPVMDGLEFLKWLREEQKSNIPVIVMTAFDGDQKIDQLTSVGVSSILIKPVPVHKLLKVVRENIR